MPNQFQLCYQDSNKDPDSKLRLLILSELARIAEKSQKSVKMSMNPISVEHPKLIRKTIILAIVDMESLKRVKNTDHHNKSSST